MLSLKSPFCFFGIALAVSVPAMAEPPAWISSPTAYSLSRLSSAQLPGVKRYTLVPTPNSKSNVEWVTEGPTTRGWPLMFIVDKKTGKACQVMPGGACLGGK
ncbi:hypothetical protein FIV34_17590 [Luteibacter pinisoli]|uniref:Uncharacterized protein n=1 Tax=Luteibacter pinisoli TaxID=2589080 RepID=A0A4Y5Z9N7_9GAMM|nr:hypothetical protein [Luteibacter pinisoli]QDE40893.1 hypothetical protein FIV34_17590 [Luteibacter pinisoli]